MLCGTPIFLLLATMVDVSTLSLRWLGESRQRGVFPWSDDFVTQKLVVSRRVNTRVLGATARLLLHVQVRSKTTPF